jgi:hypothetical protein
MILSVRWMKWILDLLCPLAGFALFRPSTPLVISRVRSALDVVALPSTIVTANKPLDRNAMTGVALGRCGVGFSHGVGQLGRSCAFPFTVQNGMSSPSMPSAKGASLPLVTGEPAAGRAVR